METPQRTLHNILLEKEAYACGEKKKEKNEVKLLVNKRSCVFKRMSGVTMTTVVFSMLRNQMDLESTLKFYHTLNIHISKYLNEVYLRLAAGTVDNRIDTEIFQQPLPDVIVNVYQQLWINVAKGDMPILADFQGEKRTLKKIILSSFCFLVDLKPS